MLVRALECVKSADMTVRPLRAVPVHTDTRGLGQSNVCDILEGSRQATTGSSEGNERHVKGSSKALICLDEPACRATAAKVNSNRKPTIQKDSARVSRPCRHAEDRQCLKVKTCPAHA